jgi:phosphoglycolate phosphatase-like HAD superfamily hydrolase
MIIFDLDGTLADCEHRRHYVQPYEKRWVDEENHYGKEFKGQCGYHYFNKDGTLWSNKPDWKAFYEACDKDEPIIPMLEINGGCLEMGKHIEIWSGRCESVREKTVDWLDYNMFSYRALKMRPIGDHTPDDELKERWLKEALAEGKTIEYVFDDRPKVIRKWREHGIFVFNCARRS